MAVDRKPTSDEFKYIQKKLDILKREIDTVDDYLNKNQWHTADDEGKRKSFKFRTELLEQRGVWFDSYVELTGMKDFYKKHLEGNKKELRKGFDAPTGAQDIIKNKMMNRLKDDKKS